MTISKDPKNDLLLRHFLELVTIDSPSGHEDEIRRKLLSELGAMGYKGEVDCAGNLKFAIPGTRSGPPRLFAAHLDTVEPGRGVKPIVESNGVIRSDGTTILGADDKDGITAIWSALEQLRDSHADHGPLELLFTVREEDNLGGSRNLQPGWLKAKIGWILDGPGRPGTIYANGVGKIGFRLQVKGRAAHSGICPEKGLNAITLCAAAIQAFPPGRQGNATVNYGTITGGNADNIVPESVILTGEIRSSDPQLLQVRQNRLLAVWSKIAAVESIPGYPAYAIPLDSPFVTTTMQVLEKQGLNPEIVDFKAGCDANYLSRIGLTVCTLAMGRSDNHTVHEITRLKHLQTMTGVVYELMTAPF